MGDDQTLLGTATALRCDGWFGYGRPHTACSAAAIALVSYPGAGLVCERHWHDVSSDAAFHSGTENGSIAARDASGIWRHVNQSWDFDLDGYPPASSAAEAKIAFLFPPLNRWAIERERALTARAYGPRSEAVLAHLGRARSLDWPEIERVGNTWDHGNRDCGLVRLHDERRVKLGIFAAVEKTGLDAAVRQAYLDGQAAVFLAYDPGALELENWRIWHLRERAMESAGYVAAVLALGEGLPDAIIELAMRPWSSRAGQAS